MDYDEMIDRIVDGLADDIRCQVLAEQMDRVRETICRLIELSELDDEELYERFREYLPRTAEDDWWEWADIQYDERRIAHALSR